MVETFDVPNDGCVAQVQARNRVKMKPSRTSIDRESQSNDEVLGTLTIGQYHLQARLEASPLDLNTGSPCARHDVRVGDRSSVVGSIVDVERAIHESQLDGESVAPRLITIAPQAKSLIGTNRNP